MAEVSVRGRRVFASLSGQPRPRAVEQSPGRTVTPRARAGELRAEDIFKMPTVDEVVRAGYPASYWDRVKADRDELVRRFNADPAFRAEAIRRHNEKTRG